MPATVVRATLRIDRDRWMIPDHHMRTIETRGRRRDYTRSEVAL
jgi:hypothetical protein